MMTIKEYLTKQLLCCPSCYGRLDLINDEELTCTQCAMSYQINAGIPNMISGEKHPAGVKRKIQAFWGDLYNAVYHENDIAVEKKKLLSMLAELNALFKKRRHLAVTEMPANEIRGKEVLEIGCGAGAHSALFASHGASMTAMDITYERCQATSMKLGLLPNTKCCFVTQGDAEKLPFSDNTFDIVYSNGVLHHTENTPTAINETYRILKPGGKAVIMLYAKHSFKYWFVLFLCKGILLGYLFKGKNWLGYGTEWMSKKKQKTYNPITNVYSKREVCDMFGQFKSIQIRKSSFSFSQLPILGKYIDLMFPESHKSEAGILLYGKPYRYETDFEHFLGRHIGFDLNIIAEK